MAKQPTRQQVAAILGAVTVLLGGGAGAGYSLHGVQAPSDGLPSMERVAALERWQAAEAALRERDREERAQMLKAIQTSIETNASLREAAVALTERMGALDARVRTVEAYARPGSHGMVRPASGRP